MNYLFSRDLADADLLSWDVASNTFRLPYFHRNSASEFLASLYGNGLGRSNEFKPGGGSFEGGHTPHGGFSDGYVNEMRIQEMGCRRILEGTFRFVLCRLPYREDGGFGACPHG
jgi:homogentisate 1,2-dioxygenase